MGHNNSRFTPDNPCILCKGTVGSGIDGAHNICAERSRLGLPTPSLGAMCPECNGIGCKPKSAFGPINPSGRTMDAWAPKCKRCKGKGAV